jgi:hypothetical protein
MATKKKVAMVPVDERSVLLDTLELLIGQAETRRAHELWAAGENTGYEIQYCPCGHSHELALHDSRVALARKRLDDGHFDAITYSSEVCPFCHPQLKNVVAHLLVSKSDPE